MTTDDWKRLEESQWPSLEFNASRLSLREIEFDHPTISIWEEAESRVGFQGSISGLSGAVTCSGSVNLKEESATVFANGSLDVYSIVPDSIKEELPQIVFSLAPYYAISAELAPGWELETIHFDLDIKNLTVDSLHLIRLPAPGVPVVGILKFASSQSFATSRQLMLRSTMQSIAVCSIFEHMAK